MDIRLRFIVFQAIIFGPFIAGFLVKRRFAVSQEFTRSLIRVNLASVEPALVLWSVWGIELSRELVALPAAGLLLSFAGLAYGFPAARMLALDGARATMFRISAMLANHGFTLGGFVCFLLLGEQGLAYAFIFVSYFLPFMFLVVFPLSARLAHAEPGATDAPILFSVQNMPLAAIVIALLLRAAGVPRPDVWFPTEPLLLLSVAVYYFTLGVNFTQGDVRSSWKEISFMSAIKFVLVPFAAFAALEFAGLHGTVRAVIQVQSFMPAAIYSVVVSVLFSLDARLASGLFVGTSVAFLAVVLPLMILGARMLGF